jgi:DNA-binding IclR family transcriptional regulator
MSYAQGPAPVPTFSRSVDGSPAVSLPSRTGAIDKTMILYETLRLAPGPVRLSELCRHTGFAKSTVHRLLTALIAAGMVARLGVRYIDAHRVAHAGRGAVRQRELLRRLAPFVCDAAIRTRCTASLATLDGLDVVFSHRVYSHTHVDTRSDATGRELAHLTAAGRMLLSRDPHTARSTLHKRDLSHAEAVELDNELTLLSRRGHATRVRPGQVACAAAVLPLGQGGQPIVITAKGRGDQTAAESMAAQLYEVALRTAKDTAWWQQSDDAGLWP